MSLQELNINLKNYFINSGFNYIELPLLFDADIFFETSGEEIIQFANDIIEDVFLKTGIKLEIEPTLI